MSIADPNVWRAAKLPVDRRRSDAPIHATQRADELMAAGDTEGWEAWKRICAAVDHLLRTEPRKGERRQRTG
jgi:hypothetical protein